MSLGVKGLISVFTLRYGSGLLFRGPSCIYTFELLKVHVIRFKKYQPDDSYVSLSETKLLP